MVNIARAFTAYRLLERQIASLEGELSRVRAERTNWQNTVLAKFGVAPLGYQPPEPKEQPPPPPIGPTQKRAYMAALPKPSESSAEDILEAARQAHAVDRNGSA